MNASATPIHETETQDAVGALWTALMRLAGDARLTAHGIVWVSDRYECPCCNQWVPSGHFGP